MPIAGPWTGRQRPIWGLAAHQSARPDRLPIGALPCVRNRHTSRECGLRFHNLRRWAWPSPRAPPLRTEFQIFLALCPVI